MMRLEQRVCLSVRCGFCGERAEESQVVRERERDYDNEAVTAAERVVEGALRCSGWRKLRLEGEAMPAFVWACGECMSGVDDRGAWEV